MSPAWRITLLMTEPRTGAAHRDRWLGPRTSWVACSARAKLSSPAVGSDADHLAVGAAQFLAAAPGARSSWPAAGPARPSSVRTWTPKSSPLVRWAIRDARRMRVSPPGAPVMATTTRSRVSHGWVMPWSSMYCWRESSTRSATHSRASSRRAARLPSRK